MRPDGVQIFSVGWQALRRRPRAIDNLAMETIWFANKYLHFLEDFLENKRHLSIDMDSNRRELQPILEFDDATRPLVVNHQQPPENVARDREKMALTAQQSFKQRHQKKTLQWLFRKVCYMKENSPERRRKLFEEMWPTFNAIFDQDSFFNVIKLMFPDLHQSHLKKISWPEGLKPKTHFHDEFDEIEIIGRGGFSIVMKARHKLDRHEYAVKQINILHGQIERAVREVFTMARLSRFENIVGYQTAWIQTADDFDGQEEQMQNGPSSETFLNPPTKQSSRPRGGLVRKFFLSKSSTQTRKIPTAAMDPHKFLLFIQMELCGINLDEHFEERNSKVQVIEWLHELWIFEQILAGLKFIHDQNIIHRDLKPHNILFNNDGKQVKIADFGLARIVQESNGPLNLSHQIGTPSYAAPEQNENLTDSYDHRVDIYSLGLILFEILYPMSTKQEKSVCFDMLRRKGSRKLPKDFPMRINPSKSYHDVFSSLILDMIQHKPCKRPKSVDIIMEKISKIKPNQTDLVQRVRQLERDNEEKDRRIKELERELKMNK